MLIAGIGRRSVHKRLGNLAKASFVLPLLDVAAGAVNLIPLVAIGNGAFTFTRATTAWTKLSTGLWASVATGVARSSYLGANSAVSAYGGYLAEGARTNLLTYSNDFTNAAWAKVTMTTAMTSTGPDGAANSATRLTASGALSTILQVLVAAASDRTWSVWARRVTGAGTIKLFQGATKTADLSASLNTNTYTQISQDATVDVTLLGVGIEIGTSTDAIDVWCGQFEAGAFASTPIPTTTVAVTRNADVLTYPLTGNLSNTAGSFYAEVYLPYAPDSSGALVVGDSASNHHIITLLSSGAMDSYEGTNNPSFNPPFVTGAVQKIAESWSGVVNQFFYNGTGSGNKTFVGDWGMTGIAIGQDGSGVKQLNGTIRNVRIYPVALTASQLQAMTT